MTMNEETIKGKWQEIKGDVQKAWGKLTNDELTQTKGDINAIAGLVMQKYGEDKSQFQKKFDDIMKRFNEGKADAVDSMKKSLKS
jgi:uncharacterized protein YjbJ (UPF0337 family)